MPRVFSLCVQATIHDRGPQIFQPEQEILMILAKLHLS